MQINLLGNSSGNAVINDFSGALASGAAQVLCPQNNDRRVFFFQNNGTHAMWISPVGTATPNGTGANMSIQVPPLTASGAPYNFLLGGGTPILTEAMTIIGTMGDTYTCFEAQ